LSVTIWSSCNNACRGGCCDARRVFWIVGGLVDGRVDWRMFLRKRSIWAAVPSTDGVPDIGCWRDD